MAIPNKVFHRFHLLNVHAEDAGNAYNLPEDYSITNNGLSRLYQLTRLWYQLSELEVCHYKGYVADGWESLPGADKCLKVKTLFRFEAPYLNTAGVTRFLPYRGSIYDKAWDENSASGRYYDGVNEWDDYPHNFHGQSGANFVYINVADLPVEEYLYHEAWCAIIDSSISFLQSTYILDRGMHILATGHTPSTALWGVGEGFGVEFEAKSATIYFQNPCVNSLSRYTGPTAGGFELKLYGLGLWNDNDEINDGCGVLNWHDWNDKVDNIYIEKPDGTVVETLQRTPAADFSVDSNGEITIAAFPALPTGVYQFRLSKVMPLVGSPTAEGYAGDWRTDATGRMTAGSRLYLWITDEIHPPTNPIVLTKWQFKKGDEYIFRYYAPIDVRADLTFYEGMILGISAFTRGTSDDRGLPIFPDIQVELDNTSQEFSKLLAAYWAKNQPVEIFYAYGDEPEVFKTRIFRGIVSDYAKPHSTWRVRLRDVLEKYLKVKIPKYKCTVEEYPNLHPNSIGKEMPEVLGRASLTEEPAPGAIEAIYVDTVNFEYLAARGSLKAINQVYSDGQLVDPADYIINYKDGGRTYIEFDNDQGENKITFNADGYTYADWDDQETGGEFVRNPAYIILFLLTFLAEVPEPDVDIPAFEDLATVYADMGVAQDGYLILQDQKDAEGPLQELLWTYGAKIWENLEGQITIGRKDPTDVGYSLTLFDQIDALEEPEKPLGFDLAVNYAPIQWEYYPTANAFYKSKLKIWQASIDAFETEMMPGTAWDFPWTTSELLVDQRASEEILKLGFGNQRLTLTVSMQHFDNLEILQNFAFQDPFGLHPNGLGEEGHRYYIEALTYDLIGGQITISAIDLDWALRQYMVLGDENVLSPNWTAAGEPERLYAYLCDEATGAFADGEPGKIKIDENIGG